MVIAGSWVYLLLTMRAPHRAYGTTAVTQSRTMRGRLLPIALPALTYHLEHRLYPRIPSHNLSKLAQRLDPILQQAGVEPRRVL